jgi:cell division protein FtsI/penicillin-binding protein 2/cell division protein FtsW (lipid II flippase)
MSSSSAAASSVASTRGFVGRALERRLLLANGALYAFAVWGSAAVQPHPMEALPEAAKWLGGIWAGCFALHLLLCLTRFDGDLLLLPLLSLVLLIGSSYHLDLAGPATVGLGNSPYLSGVFTVLVLLAVVTTSGRWFRRLNTILEEKVWWKAVGARPYYESAPVHLLLIALMALLAVLLAVKGLRGEGGALIQVPLPGGIKFTPSELIRLAIAFFLADYLARNSLVLRKLRQPLGRVWPLNRLYVEQRAELLVLLFAVGVYCLFFYLFRDFGPAAVVILLTLLALYAATGRAGTPMALGVIALLIVAIPTWKGWLFGTLRNRCEMWFSPWDTHFVNGDHLARILWSIAAGGWFGMGPGAENLPGQLPLARNDAAFAGIAATMGMWTALALLAIFALITWRGMLIARQAPTDRTRLLACCLVGLLAVQAIWICGAMVRAFPFTGINVPFISTGLTSMITSALAFGAVWNISRLQPDSTADATEATPEVLRGITRLSKPVTAAFALPAIGIILYGCPWLLGDRTLMQTGWAIGRGGERSSFSNPWLERFRQRFPRGRIFSADGKILAVSNPSPAEMDAIREVSPNTADYAARREHSGGTGERYYPLGAAAAQLVGWEPQGRFMAREGSVETAGDSLLRGYEPSALPFYYRTRRNPLVTPPQPQDLQLTVDTALQRYTQKRLSQAVKDAHGAGGAAVVYDLNTGEVLTAVTAPTFDPNGLTVERMQQYVDQNRRTQVLTNKALSREAHYFPGSTFKVLTAAAALEHEVTGSVTCRSGRNAETLRWEYAGKRWRRDPGKIADFARGGHGTLGLKDDLQHALTVSCNVFFGALAAKLGPESLRDTMVRANLGDVPEAKELAEYLPYAGFGQVAMKTTPLEMAMVAGAAGAALPETPQARSRRPHWLRAVLRHEDGRDPGTQQVRLRQPEGVYGAPQDKPFEPFSSETAARLREMMTSVVEDRSGTAYGAFHRYGATRLPGITVGGKTGTAEFEKPAAPGSRRTTIGRHAWFIGFARDHHSPMPRTIAFAVLVEDVRRGATGGTVCAPVARDLIEQILPLQGQEAPAVGDPMDRLNRLFEHNIRPRLGPVFGPLSDWLRDRLQPRR